MIFNVIKAAWQMKKGTFDAKDFAGEEAGDFATSVLEIPIILGVILILILVLFGFTPLWFGPVTVLGIIGLILIVPLFILIKIKNYIAKRVKNTIHKL